MSEDNPEIKHSISALTTFGKDGVTIEENDLWLVQDLYIKDKHGIIKETISRAKLYPIRTSKGEMYPADNREIYFKKGSGLLLLQDVGDTRLKDVQPESYCFIEKGTYHQIINTSKNDDVEYEIRHPGKLDPNRFKEQQRMVFASTTSEPKKQQQRRT